MTRTAYDGINSDVGSIPTDAQIVLGYVDGLYTWSDADWARFPHSIKGRIAVFSTTSDGHILDCEPGNCTPAQSVDWVLMRRAAGMDPTVYCNQLDPNTGWPAVRAAFQTRGVPEPHYWVANYDGATVIPPGAIAKQYADMGAYDLSVVADYWPGIDPAPTPTIRRNDMHADLKINEPVVFTNPAAVLGGTSQLLLASDFGDSTVRVAVFRTSWSVADYTIARTSSATKIPLPSDINKINVELTAGTGTVGLDVLA